jgi:hypothetical protein
MKIRNGFVSNSSSASFTVNLNDLTARDALRLLDYRNTKDSDNPRGWQDCWDMEVDFKNGRVLGWTAMDNGDLSEYFEKHEIDEKGFHWESD